MKIRNSFFILTISSSLFAACSTSDSETLRQARTIQEATLTTIASLDSTIGKKISSINEELSVLSMDSTMATDSVKIKAFDSLKAKQSSINSLHTELLDWKKSIVLLPSTEEIASGAANPFGDKAKDQDVLAALKKNQEELSEWKSKIASAVK